MGIMPVNQLLLSMSIPLMISMLVQALYNIVDSVFVARISEDALSAVSLAFPVQNLMISIAIGTAVGINALLSRSLGEGNQKKVNATAGNGIFLTILSFIAIALCGLFFSRFFYTVQTDISFIIDQGTAYLAIVTVGSFALFGEVTFDRLLQSTGKTIYTMYTQSLGAIVNIILDPILIFGLLGFPAMGVKGAAIATVIGQCCGFALSVYFNLTKNPEVQLSLGEIRPKAVIIKQIYVVGFPAILMSSVASVMTFGINKILLGFSSTAVAVFGVYFRLQSFIFMPVFGLNNATIPIIAYNYGAGNKKRIITAIKYSNVYAIAIMIFGVALFMFFPHAMLMLFDASENMLAMGIPALRIISLSFIFAGYCIASGALFMAMGNGFASMIVAIGRQLLVLLPVAYGLSRFMGINGVWLAFPIAEIVSVTLTTVFLIKIYKDKIKPMGETK